jgi:hypothetical protein
VLQTFVVALLLYFRIFIKQQFIPASHKCIYFAWIVNIAVVSPSVVDIKTDAAETISCVKFT